MNLIYFYATQLGKEADDLPEETYSYFTKVLIDELESNHTLEDFFPLVQHKVFTCSNHQQKPDYSINSFEEKFNLQYRLNQLTYDTYISNPEVTNYKTPEKNKENILNNIGSNFTEHSNNINISSLSSKTFTVNGVSFTMIPVEGGTFHMGATPEQESTWANEMPVHEVTLSSYYIGETEVTQALWQAVMGTTVTQIANNYNQNHVRYSVKMWDWLTWGIGPNYPMYYISREECQEFVKKLNALTGAQFSIPTEAQWEYAARGGNRSLHYKFSGSNNLDDVAWYWKNSGDNNITLSHWNDNMLKIAKDNHNHTHPVKSKKPNELGVYDMSGNVAEICLDCLSPYTALPQTNPIFTLGNEWFVSRGDDWSGLSTSDVDDCRVARRNRVLPKEHSAGIGMRLCLSY